MGLKLKVIADDIMVAGERPDVVIYEGDTHSALLGCIIIEMVISVNEYKFNLKSKTDSHELRIFEVMLIQPEITSDEN